MIQLLKDNRDAIAELCKRTHIASMFVFGSAAREEDYVDGESDIDLLVNFTPAFDSVASDAYFELIDGLEEILGVTVDILSERQLKNPYLIEAIHKDRVTLYAA